MFTCRQEMIFLARLAGLSLSRKARLTPLTIEMVCYSMHLERRKSCRNFKAIGTSANSRTSTIQATIATQSPLFWSIFPLASKPCKILLTAKKGDTRCSKSVNLAKRKMRQKNRAASKLLASSLRFESKIS